MMQSVKEMLVSWNAGYGERAKLQHAYVAIGVIGIIIAGLIGLLNRDLSQVIVGVSLGAFAVALANLLVWALLYSLVVIKLPARRQTTRK